MKSDWPSVSVTSSAIHIMRSVNSFRLRKRLTDIPSNRLRTSTSRLTKTSDPLGSASINFRRVFTTTPNTGTVTATANFSRRTTMATTARAAARTAMATTMRATASGEKFHLNRHKNT